MLRWLTALLAEALTPRQRAALARVRRLHPARRAALSHLERLVAARPAGISIEANSRCNARCVFCARRKIPVRNVTLELDLFERVCEQYAAMGGGFMGFSPVIADPLLDPLLLDRVRLVRERFPSIRLHMFTNLIALDTLPDEDVALLLTTLDHVDVSVGGLQREDYRAMFGVDQLDRVLAALERLARANHALGSPCRLFLHVRTFRDAAEIAASPVLQRLIALGYRCSDVLNSFSNWGGLVTAEDLPPGARLMEADSREPRKVPCLFPMIYLQIMADGTALACGCMDAKGTLAVGDVRTESIEDIWRGEPLARVRSAFRTRTLAPLCGTCTYYLPYADVLSNPGLRDYRPGENLWAKLR